MLKRSHGPGSLNDAHHILYKYNTTDYILIQGFLFVVASASSCGVSSMTLVTSPMAFVCPSRSSVVNITVKSTLAAHCSYLNLVKTKCQK